MTPKGKPGNKGFLTGDLENDDNNDEEIKEEGGSSNQRKLLKTDDVLHGVNHNKQILTPIHKTRVVGSEKKDASLV